MQKNNNPSYNEEKERKKIEEIISHLTQFQLPSLGIAIYRNAFVNQHCECFDEELVLSVAQEADNVGYFAYYFKPSIYGKVWTTIIFSQEPLTHSANYQRITF